jgi:hypothetical protein
MCSNCCAFNQEHSAAYNTGLYIRQVVEDVFAASNQSITSVSEAINSDSKMKATRLIKKQQEDHTAKSDDDSSDDDNADDNSGNDQDDDNNTDNKTDNDNGTDNDNDGATLGTLAAAAATVAV